MPVRGAYHRRRPAPGFTLLEILIVLVLMGIMIAVVAPSFFSINHASAEREAQRLARVLRLAADESALRGLQLRWTATPRGYYFEQRDAQGEWRRMQEPPYHEHAWPDGVRVLAARPQPTERGVLARYVLRPGLADGVLHLRLGSADGQGEQRELTIEPGGLTLQITLATP